MNNGDSYAVRVSLYEVGMRIRKWICEITSSKHYPRGASMLTLEYLSLYLHKCFCVLVILPGIRFCIFFDINVMIINPNSINRVSGRAYLCHCSDEVLGLTCRYRGVLTMVNMGVSAKRLIYIVNNLSTCPTLWKWESLDCMICSTYIL